MKPKQASATTRAKNSSTNGRQFDLQDLERVRRGFIAARIEPTITDDKGAKLLTPPRTNFCAMGESVQTLLIHICGGMRRSMRTTDSSK